MKNWNDVLNFIKFNFTNQLIELSDVEILEYLQNHTIKEFSQYIPAFKRVIIGESHLVDEKTSTFVIPDVEQDEIIDLEKFVPSVSSTSFSGRGEGYFGSQIDTAISEIYSSASSSYSVDILPYLDLEDPSKVTFGVEYSKVARYVPFMLILKVNHKNPSTIPTEAYHRWFKPFCLADVYILLGRARSKFQSVSTPVGQINLQALELTQQGQAMKEQIIQEIKGWNTTPPIVTIV